MHAWPCDLAANCSGIFLALAHPRPLQSPPLPHPSLADPRFIFLLFTYRVVMDFGDFGGKAAHQGKKKKGKVRVPPLQTRLN